MPDSGIRLESYEAVLKLAQEKRDLELALVLKDQVRLVAFEEGRIELRPINERARPVLKNLGRKLQEWTGRPWAITESRAEGQETLRDKELAVRAQLFAEAEADPLVKAALETFPGAKILDVKDRADDMNDIAVAPESDDDGDDGME